MRAVVKTAVLAAVAFAAIGAAPAPQNPAVVAAARQAGVIGERYDGYMGFVATPTAEMRRQVGAVNLRRRTLYIGLAARRGVSPSVVGIATACELLPRIAAGEYYMLSDGVWRRRLAGQAVALPSYCGS